MPSLDLPGELNRKRFVGALVRLGFLINQTGGKGSHFKIIWPASQKSVSLPSDLRKDVLRYVLREIESISGIGWKEIKDKL